ncbi:MAG: hypothetical protein PHR35_16475, partial [Kiritimatiellae bacterium]|nr:hypothetical protein [Kiritimatiellia bacterium]
NTITIPMSQARTIAANFAEATGGIDVGLALYYPFTVNDGNTATDASGNGQHGAVINAQWRSDGPHGGYFYFDGAGDYINAGTGVNFPAWEQYTISLWFLSDGGGNNSAYGQKLVDKSSMYHDARVLMAPDNPPDVGRVCYGVYEKQYGVHAGVGCEPNVRGDTLWHHFAAIRDGTNLTCWLDGVQGTTLHNMFSVYNSAPLYIGWSASADYYQQRFWSGYIDEVRIYNRAITPDEVIQLYGNEAIAVTLTIENARGDAVPDNDAHSYVSGAAVTASVPAVVTDGTTRYVCTGATVTGNDFTQSGPTNVTMTLTNNATLTWSWETQYELVTAVSGSGSVSGGGWYAAGVSVVLTATPDAGYWFTGWSDGETSPFRTVVVPEGGAVFTANFRVPTEGANRTIAGLAATITIVVPDGDCDFLGVEEKLSPGQIPLSISDGGNWDADNNKVKWVFRGHGQIRDRALQYTVNLAGAVVAGLVNFGTDNHPITGDTVFTGGANPGLLHPADDNGDWRIVLEEIGACVARWKSGADDYRTPVVIRGITLYRHGEQYTYDPNVAAEAKRWIPLSRLGNAGMATLAVRPLALNGPLVGAVRTVLSNTVAIVVTPEPGALAWGLEEVVPAGVQVTSVSHDGAWDVLHRKIKWAFDDSEARTLSYTFAGEAGATVTVTGCSSFDGSENTVGGTSILAVPMPFATWAAQHALSGTEEAIFNAMNAEYGQPNGFVYAFQSNWQPGDPLLTVQWISGSPVIETPKQHASTLSFIDLMPIGTTALGDGEWILGIIPAANQAGVPDNRFRWELVTTPDKAFFRLKAVLK